MGSYVMYSWGGASNGELGVGGLEDAYVSSPTPTVWPAGSKVTDIAPGGRHTLVLAGGGELYSCGSNDFGQLGREGSQTRLELVSGLGQYKVVSATCGANHSLAVDQWGSLFSWGSDESGQLGHNQGCATLRVPRLVRSLGTVKVVAVAAGLYHSAALTAGVPLAGVACGGNHTLVVTVSGAVFAFGSNNHGQLGLGDLTDRRWPTQVSTLRNLRIAAGGLVAGLEHSVALTKEGGVS